MKDSNSFMFLRNMVAGIAVLLASIGMATANSVTSGGSVPTEGLTVASPQQNKITVTGTVSDMLAPLIGVNVLEKGTSNGTITNIDGVFTLSVSPQATLVLTYIGYVTQEVPINGRTTLNITMNEDAQALDEVVVVGYGTQKKVNLTGSVSSVNFEKEALSRPVTNVSTALSGLSAGVQVMQTSGKPGSDGARIRIRGVGTLNDSDPLVLIDGIEGIMDSVNPQDIESISILKDAAASAIYGSRAANGVILITTKRGTSGQLTVNYSGRISHGTPLHLVDQVTNYADYMEYMNEAYFNVGQDNYFSPSTIELWRRESANPNAVNELGVPNYIAYPNTDWQKTLFGNGLLNDHNVSVNGGSEKIRFLLSAGYLDNPGLVENTGSKRYSLRANIEANVTDWLKVGTRTYATQEDIDQNNFTNANNYLRQTTPGIYPRWNGQYGYPEAPEESATANNILDWLNRTDGSNRKSRFNTTLFSQVKFFKGFSWDFNFSYSRRIDEVTSWTAPITTVQFSTGEVKSSPNPSTMDTYFYTYGNESYTIQNMLNYATTIARDHDITALAGYEEYWYNEYSHSATKRGLLDPSITAPSTATEMRSITGSSHDRASRSFFGRLTYAYKSRYLFEANVRYDGSGRFHKDHRWGAFPSFAGGWRISEEDFMANTRNWLDNMKLRLSYGELGNNRVGEYTYQSVYGAAHYPIGGSIQPGLWASNIANTMLTWESAATTNIGLDLAMLNNRLTFEVDVYKKETKGILYAPAIYYTAGLKTAPVMNIAELSNKGIELTVGWKDNIEDFNYSVSGNFTYVKNRIDKYKGKLVQGWFDDENGNKVWRSNLGDVASSTTSVNPIIEGKIKNEFYLVETYKGSGKGYEVDGINGGPKDGMIRTEQDMEWLKAMIAGGYRFHGKTVVGKSDLWYGDYIYADTDGNGIYGQDNDRVFQGVSSDPKYYYGLQLSASYKGFDVSMNWAGAAGFKLYWGATTGYNSPTMRPGLALPSEIANNHYFYDPENPNDARTNINAKYGRLINEESGFPNSRASTNYLYNGDYLKLKNLTIGYTLPTRISKKALIQNIRFYVSGENLLTFNSFPGQDPEMGATPEYVPMRQFAFGTNITF